MIREISSSVDLRDILSQVALIQIATACIAEQTNLHQPQLIEALQSQILFRFHTLHFCIIKVHFVSLIVVGLVYYNSNLNKCNLNSTPICVYRDAREICGK